MRIADELQVDCPVFYIDNVAEYYYSTKHGAPWSTWPQCVPPFPEMLVELRATIPPGGFQHFPGGHTIRAAVRLNTYRLTEGGEPAGWGILAREYRHDENWPGHPFEQSLQITLSEAGTIEEVFTGDGQQAIDMTHAFDDGWGIAPAMLAVAMMHCKNVRHVEHAPKLKQGKGWREVKSPTLRYYTLEIDPMKETLRREGNVETVGLAKALHICRGHFKDYRQSGLFGKIKGIFWWGPALRGAPEHGQVVKDYAVKAPTPPETVH